MEAVEKRVWKLVGGKGDPPTYSEVARWAHPLQSPQPWRTEAVKRVNDGLDDLSVCRGLWTLQTGCWDDERPPTAENSQWSFNATTEMEVLIEDGDVPTEVQKAIQGVKALGGSNLWGDNWMAPGWSILYLTIPMQALLDHLDAKANNGEEPAEHPFAPIARAYVNRPRKATERKVDHVTSKTVKASKLPAIPPLSLAPTRSVMTILSEGEPLASPTPQTYEKVRWTPHTDDLFDPFPRTLGETATGDIALEAMARWHVEGRKTLKADVTAISLLIFALTHPIEISTRELLRLFGWRPSDKNYERLDLAMDAARSLAVYLGRRRRRWLFDIQLDMGKGLEAVCHLAAGFWWQNGAQDGDANAWRMSGMLFQSATAKTKGLSRGYWGTARRFLVGVEAALQNGPTSGKGRDGRTSEWVKSERPGDPGPEVFIPAWKVLSLAGEYCNAEIYRTDSAPRKRYGRLLNTLKQLDYDCHTPSATAKAGSTVEVVKIHGGRGRGEGGLTVRATARFVDIVAARANPKRWDALSLDRLIERND